MNLSYLRSSQTAAHWRHIRLQYAWSLHMQLDDYFAFLSPDDIRIKGHRIGIESVLYEYIHRGQTAEQIAERFPTITLEQVYATILYYLHNKKQVSKYVAVWLEDARQKREEQSKRNSPFIERVRRLKAERAASE
ncbi:MAG TPA: DUF433 domain-containing protein [Humisphaera sp.]|nr:DUF433 domain-containing protein [Humisphaera sp.]